ncbi:hypothetical protein ACF0H5_020666 [Mactra antiquata]
MAVSLNVPKHYRSWKNEDLREKSDIVRLFDPEKVKSTKNVHCSKYFTVYSTLVGFFVLFLIGILVGFLLRDDPKLTSNCFTAHPRKDGFDRETLQAVHNNIVYYMSKEELTDHISELSALQKSSTVERLDRSSAEYVAGQFRKYGVDRVNIEEHSIVVTSPDPDNPNRLEILSPDGATRQNFTFTKGVKSRLPVTRNSSLSNKVKGPVVFGNFGKNEDFIRLRESVTSLKESVVLLKLGKNSVSNKIWSATWYGCSAMLLYCDKEDTCCHGNQCDADEIPDVTVGDFTEYHSNDVLPIPVQTVSYNVAMTLLESVNQSTSSENDLHNSTNNINQTDGSVLVLLQIYTKHVVQSINNVVATIYGADEPDRMIVIGSERNGYERNPSHFHGTGILMELARSMSYIMSRELWKPRRTIRFVSLGGNLHGFGLQQYFESNRHILQQEGIAYIDLDLHNERSPIIDFKSDITLWNLMKKAYNMVPDPTNPEISLAEKWPSLFQNPVLTNQIGSNILRTDEYLSCNRLGIPTVVMQLQTVINNKTNLIATRETNYIQKYSLALGRVVSHASLKLLDDIVLPFNITIFSELLQDSINKIVERLQTKLPGIHHFDLVSRMKTLSQSINNLLGFKECSKLRSLNDFLIRFENIFYIQTAEESSVLHSDSGSLPVILNELNAVLLRQNEEMINNMLQRTLLMLEEAQQEITSLTSSY